MNTHVRDNFLAIAGVTGVPGYSQTSPADAAIGGGGSYLMFGFAASITPTISGRIFACIDGEIANVSPTGNGTDSALLLQYSTGAAPVNMAAYVGTVAGIPQTYKMNNDNGLFSISRLITGLAVGTPYWLDLSTNAEFAGGTINARGINILAYEF